MQHEILNHDTDHGTVESEIIPMTDGERCKLILKFPRPFCNAAPLIRRYDSMGAARCARTRLVRSFNQKPAERVSEHVRSEEPGDYAVTPPEKDRTDYQENLIIREALQILERRLSGRRELDQPLQSPQATRDYLRLKLAEKDREHFSCMFMDTRHRLIKTETLFKGTIDSAHVHPRIVVERALRAKAAAVIVAHNHPSGIAEPSQSDLAITRRLRDALGLIDVRLLDHFIVGEGEVVSLAERGLV